MKRNKSILVIGAFILFLAVFEVILYKIYIPRVNAFGCFDDCFNFMGGYFLLNERKLFSEIFYNHSPFMAYISFFIQFFTHPQNLYELVLRHRQFLLLFGFIFHIVLVIRFRLKAFAFIIFYELTKFYLFGDRFLAEAFVVYPLVYLVGLVWYKFKKVPLQKIDYILAGIFTWFIIFTREPIVPAALLLLGFILWRKKEKKNSIIGLGIFVFLSVFTILFQDVKEFFFNVFTINSSRIFSLEAGTTGLVGFGILKIFLYPFILLFGGEWGHFRIIMTSLSVIFLLSSVFLIWKKKSKQVVFLWVLLGLLNIRYVEPGKVFYGAFHLLCWYGVFIFVTYLMIASIYKLNKKIALGLGILYFCLIIFHIVSPASFLHEKVDSHTEFITNFGIPMQVGNVVSSLSKSTDTLFLDGTDDIIYWQAKRYSSYKYSWYTSVMPFFKKYTDARTEMFLKSPPDFYYGTCVGDKDPVRTLPESLTSSYVRLYNDDRKSCLWVKKTKLPSITTEQWKKASESHYHLSEDTTDSQGP